MKISAQFMKNISGFVLMLFLLAPITVMAQDDIVFIPIVSRAKPLKNIITVAKAKGDFTDPVAAVNSINDASAENPYLVVIGPGIYTLTQTLVMKEYVGILGSGENFTKLQGAISTGSIDASSAVVSGANNVTLSSLTVENTGGSMYSIALYNVNASPTVTNVAATGSGGTENYGVFNASSSPTMTSVTATGSGGSYTYGVRNASSSPTMTSVTAEASGGTYNYSVRNDSSSPTMTNVTATGSGGLANYGVINLVSSSPTMRRSTMEGDTYSLYTDSTTATVSQSTLIGAVHGGTKNTCVACDNGSGTALNGNCTTP